MAYLPHTEAERRRMLEAIGVADVHDLFRPIPAGLRRNGLDLPDGRSEAETRAALERLAAENTAYRDRSFLGGGSYNHYAPAAVRALAGRTEFATAYTPYQSEVAQGTLQHIFEFQTAIAELTGLDIANASLYDGPSALAEAAFMALRHTRRERIVVSPAVHPEALAVVRTYASGPGFAVDALALDEASGRTLAPEPDALEGTGAVLLQQPNIYGVVEDLEPIVAAAHAAGSLAVVSNYPVALGLLAPPGQVGADIAVGDVQPFGNPRSFGGPSAGYLAARQELLRQLPGRLVGQTLDEEGRVSYALTLQAREQHIRRSKATSNICSNQALNALAATIHLALLGPAGLRNLAEICLQRAHHLADALTAVDGVELLRRGPFVNEFALRLPLPAEEFLAAMRSRGFDAGVSLQRLYQGWTAPDALPGDVLLVAVTEANPPEALAAYADAAREVVAQRGDV